MLESLPSVPASAVAVVLLALLLAGIEGGHRLGRRRAGVTSAAARDHILAVQSATVGLLALLIAFTFSLALQRHDGRSDAVVNEANAIGTAFLRADLLSAPLRDEARRTLAGYVALRVHEAELTLPERSEREAVNARAAAAQQALWDFGVRASRADPASPATLSFALAVNELIDSFGRRNAALDRHVPSLVTALLLATFALTSVVMGYAAGVAEHRPSLATYVLVGLMVVLVFIVLDLDRPRRGVIRVDPRPLVELQAAVAQAIGPGASAPGVGRP